MENQITLKSLVKDSVFGSVGTIKSQTDIATLVAYLRYNKPFLDNFNDIILSLNGDAELLRKVALYIEPIISNNLHIVVSENLGHTFGTFLSDSAIISYASQLPHKYIWKFSNDVIVNETIFDKLITANKDFYYINNIGYNIFNTYSKNQLLLALINQEFYYPQTNYYIIKNQIDFYPSESEIYKLKNEFESISLIKPGIQPWHAIDGCDCEHMLTRTVNNNNLSKEHLLSEKTTKAIIEFIYDNQIHDGSHKNIAYSELGNLCHLQWPNRSVFYI